ncbi:MAG: ATP-binding protein [Spirochaetia bacterium]|jgi:PAS domain S-box-containing protein|nr:ATP-binding protein [Spirochaetia bacterium]
MFLRKKLNVIILGMVLLVMCTIFVGIYNVSRYTQNNAFQAVLNKTKWSIETTKIMLEEYLITPGPRTFRQLASKYEDFKTDQTFTLLAAWQERFRMITPVLAKRDDFIFIVGLLIEQSENGLLNQSLYRETASQAFLIAHEMSSYMIDLSVQSNDKISKDTWLFIGVLGLSLVVFIPFILFMVLWVRTFVLSRIVALELATCRIAEGDYSKEIDESGDDELSSLAHSFRIMQISVRDNLLALAQEKERLKTILLSIGDAVIAVDGQGLVTLMNPVAERLTGWNAYDAQGHLLEEVFVILQEGSRLRQENPVARVLKTGETMNLANHTLLLSRLGPEYQIADSAAPILMADGFIEGVVLVFRDVTEHNRMQSLMIQSEKMLSVGGLAAGMAHEINNPLSGMLQTASVIETRLSEDLPANREAALSNGIKLENLRAYMEARGIFRMLTTLKDSGGRIGKIVNNMLSFAKKSNSQVSSHDMSELVDGALELAATDYDMKKEYDFRSVRIERHYEPDLPLVPCDSGQIQQVILNILRNGAEELHQAKTSNARFDIRIYKDTEQNMVCVSLSDNGPGIEESIRRRVFEPFFTTKPVSIGTGLGLSISYFIITENHNGQMEVISEPGKGASFVIRLPVIY